MIHHMADRLIKMTGRSQRLMELADGLAARVEELKAERNEAELKCQEMADRLEKLRQEGLELERLREAWQTATGCLLPVRAAQKICDLERRLTEATVAHKPDPAEEPAIASCHWCGHVCAARWRALGMRVECLNENCSAMGPVSRNMVAAITEWNRLSAAAGGVE